MKFTPAEEHAIRILAHRMTIRSLARVLNRPPSVVRRFMVHRGIPGRSTITEAAGKAILQAIKEGRQVAEGTVLYHDAGDARAGKAWTLEEDNRLAEYAGEVSINTMATLMSGRSVSAIRHRLYATGLAKRHYQYSIQGFIERLKAERGITLSAKTVRRWTRKKGKGANDSRLNRVKYFREGNRIYLGKDDAEWLLENYAWGESFPAYPSKDSEAIRN